MEETYVRLINFLNSNKDVLSQDFIDKIIVLVNKATEEAFERGKKQKI